MYKIIVDNNSTPLDGKPYRISGDELHISRQIYKSISSVVFNEKLDENNMPSDIIKVFCDDMQKMYDGPIIDPTIEAINMYLGSLGINNEYPLKSDKITLEKFINTDYELPGDNIGDNNGR